MKKFLVILTIAMFAAVSAFAAEPKAQPKDKPAATHINKVKKHKKHSRVRTEVKPADSNKK